MSDSQINPSPLDGRARGSNQSGLRAHNERAVLSLIRRNGEMAKAEIARRTGLSAQTASVIMRSLETEALVIRDAPRRGKVGQPSVPMRLNPDGALSFGLKIGRRSSELILMDFVGQIRSRRVLFYKYPRVQEVREFFETAYAELYEDIEPQLRQRVTGLGVAMPFELWAWAQEIGAPEADMAPWRDFDVEAEFSALTGLSVHIANDATGACAAENVFGGADRTDFVYFFVGAFVGGGLVMNGDLVLGPSGNAGALGSLPVPRADGGAGQLIEFASINGLEIMVREEGRDPQAAFSQDASWGDLGDVLNRWIEKASCGLAYAIVSTCAVYDFKSAVIDGALPRDVLQRLIEATRARFEAMDRTGLSPVEVQPGSVGASARTLGAASLPLFARFLLDQRAPYAERA